MPGRTVVEVDAEYSRFHTALTGTAVMRSLIAMRRSPENRAEQTAVRFDPRGRDPHEIGEETGEETGIAGPGASRRLTSVLFPVCHAPTIMTTGVRSSACWTTNSDGGDTCSN